MVGSAIVRRLTQEGYGQIVTRARGDLDLTRQSDVEQFFQAEKIDAVFLVAARVGGIHANSTYPVEFLAENLSIELNVIQSAAKYGVQKLLFLGSSCIYPKLAPQPIREESLLTSALETTNEAYALSKIAGLKLCEYYYRQYSKVFISAMPTNLYGPGDNFHPENSHVIPGLLRRFHEAKTAGLAEVRVWGTGTPRREFLHVDDLARAAVFLMREYSSPNTINVGTGADLTIAELAHHVARTVGYTGKIAFDASRPDGTPRKVLDTSRITSLGFTPQVPLEEGLAAVYAWALQNHVL